MARLLLSLVVIVAAAANACTKDPGAGSKGNDRDRTAPADVTAQKAKVRPAVIDTGDLDAIVARGALRVLVFGDGELLLPRDGGSTMGDRDAAQALARRLGVAHEPIVVDEYGELIPKLLAGEGDIIAARMADTDARRQKVQFTQPTEIVSELLVHKKGDAAAPRTLAELAGKTVTVRNSSSYRETLDALRAGHKLDTLTIVDADEDKDTAALVQDVAAGQIAYTVCDSDLFAHLQAFTPDVEATLVLEEGRRIALALRPDNPKLKAATDAVLVQRALTAHRRKKSTGDLAEMKERGSIRMLTRNNAISYFLHQGDQRGFDYELLKMFADEHGLRLDVVVPTNANRLLPSLQEGRGDVIAAQLTVTDARAAQIGFSTPYHFAEEVLIQPAGQAPITALAALRGKAIHVRKSSSYRSTLEPLAAKHGFTIVDAPEDKETEELITAVGAGELPLTVADTTIASVELSYGAPVQATLVLSPKREIAYGVRPENKELLTALNAFVKKRYRGLEYNMLKKRYFENKKNIEAARAQATRTTGALSDYDDLIKQRSTQYQLDWRLMAAQAYQESRFDPNAKSWVGALGLFQVMPATGKEMGFLELTDPDIGTHAGVRYMAKLIQQFDEDLPIKERVRFALASYNAGRGHVLDARRLAAELGLDPNRWFGNVEKAMLLLSQPQYAKQARHGYCRGAEPVHYVSNIQLRYESYLAVVKDIGAGPR